MVNIFYHYFVHEMMMVPLIDVLFNMMHKHVIVKILIKVLYVLFSNGSCLLRIALLFSLDGVVLNLFILYFWNKYIMVLV